MFKEIEKNQVELTNEQKCWEEIQASLKKHNCELSGFGTTWDSDYDYEHVINAIEFGVESIDFNNRQIKALEYYAKAQEVSYQKACKDKYDELVSKYSKYKKLEIVAVGEDGSSAFWVKGLKVRKENVKKPLFSWNPNRFWQYSEYAETHHGTHVWIDDINQYIHYKGQPAIHCFVWSPFRHSPQHCAWFTFNKKMDMEVYADMINVCKIIDDLIAANVLYFE